MTDDEQRDPVLQNIFAEAGVPLDDQQFRVDVMARIEQSRRRTKAGRVALAALLAAAAIPAQDLGLAAAELVMVQLVEINNQAAADALAPINTVGGVLSLVLLFLRTLYRRMLRR